MQRKQLLIIFVCVEEFITPTTAVQLTSAPILAPVPLLDSNALIQSHYVKTIFMAIDMVTVLGTGVHTLAKMCMIQLGFITSLQLAAIDKLPSCKMVNIFALVQSNIRFVTRVTKSIVVLLMLPVRRAKIALTPRIISVWTINLHYKIH